MSARSTSILLSVLAFSASPAVAMPDCDESDEPGIHISMGFQVGGRYTTEEQEIFDKMHLRQNGISARSVRRTATGCLEVFREEGSGFVTEYYDPKTFELKLDLD